MKIFLTAIGDELLKERDLKTKICTVWTISTPIGHQLEGSLVCKDTTEEISNGLNLIINNTSLRNYGEWRSCAPQKTM